MIGRNVQVYQQVTIGSNTLKDSKGAGAPVIGDNVHIGAGAKIIGGVRIDNVDRGQLCSGRRYPFQLYGGAGQAENYCSSGAER